jgi:hypothetical protein
MLCVQILEYSVTILSRHVLSQVIPCHILLQLWTMCYIKPVLAFGTEQDIIINSCHPRSQHSQRSVCLMSISKSATVKWYCLREFENEFSREIQPSSNESKQRGHESEMVKRVIDKMKSKVKVKSKGKNCNITPLLRVVVLNDSILFIAGFFNNDNAFMYSPWQSFLFIKYLVNW